MGFEYDMKTTIQLLHVDSYILLLGVVHHELFPKRQTGSLVLPQSVKILTENVKRKRHE